VFELFEYPTFDSATGDFIDYQAYERMWAFTLVMKGKEVFTAQDTKRLSR
jgi:hypothetical protein